MNRSIRTTSTAIAVIVIVYSSGSSSNSIIPIQKYVNDANKSYTMYCNIDEECMKDFVVFFSFVRLFACLFVCLFVVDTFILFLFFSGIFALLSHYNVEMGWVGMGFGICLQEKCS